MRQPKLVAEQCLCAQRRGKAAAACGCRCAGVPVCGWGAGLWCHGHGHATSLTCMVLNSCRVTASSEPSATATSGDPHDDAPHVRGVACGWALWLWLLWLVVVAGCGG